MKTQHLKIAIVTANYNVELAEILTQGAKQFLIQNLIKEENINVYYVPGIWEIPIVCKKIIQTNIYAGIIALGTVLKGETEHYELIAQTSTQALMSLSMQMSVPITHGILAADQLEKIQQRAGGSKGNKGVEAGNALLKTLKILTDINC